MERASKEDREALSFDGRLACATRSRLLFANYYLHYASDIWQDGLRGSGSKNEAAIGMPG